MSDDAHSACEGEGEGCGGVHVHVGSGDDGVVEGWRIRDQMMHVNPQNKQE